MKRWSLEIDWRVIKKVYLIYLAYIVTILLFSKNLISCSIRWENELPRVSTNAYIYLQFIVCIIVCYLTSTLFEETFKEKSFSYLKSFSLSLYQTIVKRVIYLIAIIEVPYLIAVFQVFRNINISICELSELFEEFYNFPLITLSIPLFQCFISINFYIWITIFLLGIFKQRILPVVLLMSYCALEAGPLSLIWGRFSIFSGAFSEQDYYTYFPSNIKLILIFMLLIIPSIFIIYKYRKE